MKACLRRITGIFLLASVLSPSVAEQAQQISLLTGSEQGTYYQMGRDLRQLVFPDIQLEVVPSAGSMINLMYLSGDHSKYTMGMVQSDALVSHEAAMLRVEDLRIVTPLSLEEVHLLARPSIKTLQDLEGKFVAVGITGSGTNVTADAILTSADLSGVIKVHRRPFKALMDIRSGKIDAMFYVAGAPARLLGEVGKEDNLHLVPISLKGLSGLTPVTISAKTYPWQNEEVATLAVTTLLITGKMDTSDPVCQTITRVVRALTTQMNSLRKNGHPKWRKINVDKARIKATGRASPCALAAFR